MGGHGGLNILPQKKWNVYNFDNREKVRKDEEAAAKEEQIKREQSRKRDSEFRLQKLRLGRGIPVPDPSSIESISSVPNSNNHINLFEGLKDFPSLASGEDKRVDDKRRKLKKEEAVVPSVVSAEDDKYRLGYGVAGKGVKAPWYLSRPTGDEDIRGSSVISSLGKQDERKKSVKKTVEEMREERLKREKREKERELALIRDKNNRGGSSFNFQDNSRSSRYYL